MVKLEERLLLYAVTDESTQRRDTLLEQIERALKGGVTLVQLKGDSQDVEHFTRGAVEVKSLCSKYGIPLIIHDNIDVALRSGADGVFLSDSSQNVAEVRRLVGSRFLIGTTVGSVEQAKRAQRDGADYLGVWIKDPPAPSLNPVCDGCRLRAICSSVAIPAVALGGMDQESASKLSGSGVKGFADSSLFAAKDITIAALNMRATAEDMVFPQ